MRVRTRWPILVGVLMLAGHIDREVRAASERVAPDLLVGATPDGNYLFATDRMRRSVLLVHRASRHTTRVNLQDMRKTSALRQAKGVRDASSTHHDDRPAEVRTAIHSR